MKYKRGIPCKVCGKDVDYPNVPKSQNLYTFDEKGHLIPNYFCSKKCKGLFEEKIVENEI